MDWRFFLDILFLGLISYAFGEISSLRKQMHQMRQELDVSLPPPSEEVMRLAEDGKKIRAMRLYRKQTGVTLLEAKEIIGAISHVKAVNGG